MIRRATHEDIKAVLDYMEEYHRESNLSDIPFDRKSAFKIVQFYLEHRDCCALIAEKNGELDGLLFGSLEPYFFNQKKSYATDLMFMSGGQGASLWKRFRDWAFEQGAERIIMGVSSGEARADMLLEALGMHNTGGMYVLCQEGS